MAVTTPVIPTDNRAALINSGESTEVSGGLGSDGSDGSSVEALDESSRDNDLPSLISLKSTMRIIPLELEVATRSPTTTSERVGSTEDEPWDPLPTAPPTVCSDRAGVGVGGVR